MRTPRRLPIFVFLFFAGGWIPVAAQRPADTAGRLTVIESPAAASPARTLKARTVPPKEPLHFPPGQKLRVLVKFRDEFRARSTDSGELVVRARSPKDVASLATLVRGEPMRFFKVSTVSEEKLEALAQRAAQRTGREQPDLGGLLEVMASESATRDQSIAIAQKFHRLPEVEYVLLESIDEPPPPPASDIPPASDLLVGFQTYRTATGINADAAWTTYGVRGDGVRLSNCEYQYNPNHEDLFGLVTLQAGIASMYTGFGDHHGTATLGEVVAGENEYGMSGICPAAPAFFYPESSTRTNGTTQSRAAAIMAAVADSSPGDVVMLEMQTGGPNGGNYVPAEYNLAVWNIVKTGTDAGVIVVAAAGNGAENLDAPSYDAYRARGDSGAIIVGAGSSARSRSSFSTYGSRINLQGWGGGVASLGYGNLRRYGEDHNQEYTGSFSGTSSATPIVAGAVVLVQSLALETIGRPLAALELRQLLVETGKPQTGNLSQPIGPLPDLHAALPDLYRRFPLKFTRVSGWGRYYFGTPVPDFLGNADRDQYNNLLEYFFGTNPNASVSREQTRWPVVQFTGDRVVLAFANSPDLTDIAWVAEASETLASDSWQPMIDGEGGVTIVRQGELVQVEAPRIGPRQFFRIKVSLETP